MTISKAIAALTLAGGLLLGAPAWAQPGPPSGTPPSWETLTHCADIADDDDQLACFRAAMKAAGYRPSAAVASAHRKGFGVTSALRRKSKGGKGESEVAQGQGPEAGPAEEGGDKNEVTVQLAQVALIPPGNKLLLVTTDGAIWEQLDPEQISPLPTGGGTMVIKRNHFGGYFCVFDKRNSVRCERTH